MARIYQIPTSSTAQAMAVLNQYRAQQIADGKIIGEQLCRLYGATHSRAILDEMNRRGLHRKNIPDFWIGAVLRDPRFVNTGRVVRPPIPRDSAIHDAHLIWLWRLVEGGVGPLILYEYAEYCRQRPIPSVNSKVLFILRHIAFRKTDKRWYGNTIWQDDEHLRAIRRNLTPYTNWIRLFEKIKKMNAGSQAKARAEARRLIVEFITHGDVNAE
jgi:hypothetical protein